MKVRVRRDPPLCPTPPFSARDPGGLVPDARASFLPETQRRICSNIQTRAPVSAPRGRLPEVGSLAPDTLAPRCCGHPAPRSSPV